VRQPDIAEETIISFLTQNELSVVSESWIDLAMPVQVGSILPGAILVVQKQDHAFADVDEYSDISATSCNVAVTATQFFIARTANRLGTEYIPTEEANTWIRQILSRCSTPSSIGFIHQYIEVFWKPN